jgi:hypothetical protein
MKNKKAPRVRGREANMFWGGMSYWEWLDATGQNGTEGLERHRRKLRNTVIFMASLSIALFVAAMTGVIILVVKIL